jgi:hypothetical protein
MMTRAPPSASHLPVCLHETSGEDRRTYTKWVRISLTCYFLLIAGLIILRFSVHGSDIQAVSEGQTAGIGAASKPVRQHHPGG